MWLKEGDIFCFNMWLLRRRQSHLWLLMQLDVWIYFNCSDCIDLYRPTVCQLTAPQTCELLLLKSGCVFKSLKSFFRGGGLFRQASVSCCCRSVGEPLVLQSERQRQHSAPITGWGPYPCATHHHRPDPALLLCHSTQWKGSRQSLRRPAPLGAVVTFVKPSSSISLSATNSMYCFISSQFIPISFTGRASVRNSCAEQQQQHHH